MVQQRISEFARKEALPSLTRSGCAYLMEVTAYFLASCFIFNLCIEMLFLKVASCNHGSIRKHDSTLKRQKFVLLFLIVNRCFCLIAKKHIY
jgi:hypothetical protein